jgi:PleD family two-component response regulator
VRPSSPLPDTVFTPDATPRPPVILIVSEQEWLARSLETLVAEHGIVTMRAYGGRDALSLGMDAVADVVVCDTRLADVSGVDLARALQATSDLGTALPVVLLSTDDLDRQAVLEALEAGVWEYLAFPFDGASFCARLRTFAGAKRRADRFRDESLLDQPTGVYSLRGLTRRARELGAGVQRMRTPIGCVAVAADILQDGEHREPPASEAALLADLLRHTARASDVVGRTGAGEFAVFTPGSGPEGTFAYVERLEAAVNTTPRGAGQAWRLRAAWCAASGDERTPDPVDMLQRTSAELRKLRGGRASDVRVREVAVPESAAASAGLEFPHRR